MELLIFIALAFLVAHVVTKATSDEVKVNPNNCPPHTWVNDFENHLFCKVCKVRPGELQSDYDKPY